MSPPPPDAPARDLSATVVRLCRALRERGVPATPAEGVDAVRALEAVDLGDRREVYLALRAVLTTRRDDEPAFREAFESVWAGEEGADPLPAPRPVEPLGRTTREPRGRGPARRPGPEAPRTLRSWMGRGEGEAEEGATGIRAVSRRQATGPKDFSTYGTEELESVRRAAERIARRLARKRSRRWKPSRRGRRVHLRRTIRRAVGTGGDLVELVFRERKRKKTKLVVLCDVSGSMDLYSRVLLQFLFALQKAFDRVETFVFSTGLSRITGALREGSYLGALDRLAREVEGWSGGTRIGECLAEFEERWGGLVDRRTVLVILSDGWDTGEPGVLEGAMRRLHRRAGKVVWLNPLLGSPDYRPETRGMKAALPHVDVFAPAHDVPSLEALADHLTL